MGRITVTDVRGRFPEFDDPGDHPVSDVTLVDLIDEAYRYTNVARRATLWCVRSHLAALEAGLTGDATGGGGVVTMEKEGPMTAEYKTQAMSERDVFLVQTPYGERCRAIERRTPAAVLRVVRG